MALPTFFHGPYPHRICAEGAPCLDRPLSDYGPWMVCVYSTRTELILPQDCPAQPTTTIDAHETIMAHPDAFTRRRKALFALAQSHLDMYAR